MYRHEVVTGESVEMQKTGTLLRQVWPKAEFMTDAYLQWLYVDNPFGKAVGVNAYSGDELAAHYVTVPVEAEVLGKRRRGLLSLNTATHPNHQGKQLFTKLATATYDNGASQGYEFVVGVANANSTPGFIRKLGFTLVSPLDARVGYGPVRRRPAGELQFCRTWDEKTLAWRLRAPARRYAQRSSGGDVSVFAPSGYPMIQAWVGRYPVGLGAAKAAAQMPGAAPMPWVWIGIDRELEWGWTLSSTIPKRLRPSPLNLIFRWLTSETTALDPKAVRYDALDFDAY